MAHHINSPSALERRKLCPGSRWAEDGLPSKGGDNADEGTRRHKLVECFLSGQTHVIKDSEDETILTKCHELIKSVKAENAKMYLERKLTMYGSDCSALTDGTPDVAIVHGKQGWIIDWKFGRNPVPEAAKNLQLAAYSVALAQEFDLEEVQAIVFQPLINYTSSHVFKVFDGVRDFIESIIADSNERGSKRIPCEEACRYCRAAEHGKCPEFLAQGKAEVVKMDETPLSSIATWSDQDLADFKAKMNLVHKVAGIVDAELKARIALANGQPVAGYKSVTVSGRSSIDTRQAYDTVKDIVDIGEFTDLCSIPYGKLCDLYAKSAKEKSLAKTLKEGKQQADSILGAYVVKGESYEKLVKVGCDDDMAV